MKKITTRKRRSYEDALWRETTSKKLLKEELMKDYRYPARYAKKKVKELFNDAVQYWAFEDCY